MEKVESYGVHESASSEERDVDQISPVTGEPEWLGIARDAYTQSTLYFDANIRKQIERNLQMFQGKHPTGSKYRQDAYKYRSKIFRPKLRSSTRRHEAAADRAFFGTLDKVSTLPEDSRDDESVLGARYGKNWLEFRLEHSIPWHKTVIGAYQDAMNQGVVIARVEWVYEESESTVKQPVLAANGLVDVDEMGIRMEEDVTVYNTVVDKPDIVLVPVENMRFSTAADWRDPMGTSPFLIEMIPMYVGDVKARMKQDDNKTREPKWNHLTDEQIKAGNKTGEWDSTRLVRENQRQDSKDEEYQLKQFDVVWVHRNIIRHDNVDYIYYTLGTEFMLSDPVPLEEVYLHGRPYTMGVALIETHKNYSAGLPEITEDLTIQANEIANQRLDNVKLVMNKRYMGRRGANVDWRSLVASVPGGVTLMDDLDNDVKEMDFKDVTGSAYQEQDRVNADFDELVGNFSSGSVQTNRSLNETVGGMAMNIDDSNVITEYQLRCFTESWVEDTLRKLLTLGQRYESDPKVLQIAGEGEDPATVAALMDTAYKVKVSVGFGATSPHKRIEKLSIGLKTIAEVMPEEMRNINGDEVKREVFGALGFRDADRFFTPIDENKDPMLAKLEQENQQLKQMIETGQAGEQTKLQVAQMKIEADLQREQMKLDLQREIATLDTRIAYIGQQVAAEKNDIARGELLLQQEALAFKKKERELELLTDENDRMSSVLMNDNYGDVPAAEG